MRRGQSTNTQINKNTNTNTEWSQDKHRMHKLLPLLKRLEWRLEAGCWARGPGIEPHINLTQYLDTVKYKFKYENKYKRKYIQIQNKLMPNSFPYMAMYLPKLVKQKL